jgi:hypothetical protein
MNTTKPGVRPKNQYRISLQEALDNAGMDFEAMMNDSVIPACCSEGCEVEPDGRCEHGCPSVLLAMGVI